VTFLLRVEIISEIFEEPKLVRYNGNTVAPGFTRVDLAMPALCRFSPDSPGADIAAPSG
jgi:hypothetical protein